MVERPRRESTPALPEFSNISLRVAPTTSPALQSASNRLDASREPEHFRSTQRLLMTVDALRDAVRKSGTPLCKTLRNEPWQMRKFGLVTPDGHRIMLGTPISND
jgi:hypothetical protein